MGPRRGEIGVVERLRRGRSFGQALALKTAPSDEPAPIIDGLLESDGARLLGWLGERGVAEWRRQGWPRGLDFGRRAQ